MYTYIRSLFCLMVLFFAGNIPTNAQIAELFITKYGAVGDGKTLNTKAIQKAIDDATAQGGGKVVVPAGRYLSGAIFLKDNVVLEIQANAVLLGSTRYEDYPDLPRFITDSKPTSKHFINIRNAKNVTIQGTGTIDGQGQAFWKPETKYPRWIYEIPGRVSNMLELGNSQDIWIKDVLLTNSPEWTCHLFDCDRVNITGLRIQNPLFGPNNDGIDISGCRDVQINNCNIRTCDDAICLKTYPRSRSCERITVTNCIIATNCVALKVGNETHHDIRQATFSNCVIYNTSRPIAIYNDNGGIVEDIVFSNIVSETNTPLVMNRPIHFNLYNKKNHGPSILRNVSISNFVSTTNGRILLTAEQGTMMENITLRDIKLNYVQIEDPYNIADSARSAQMSSKNKVARRQRAAVIAENVKNLQVDNLVVNWPNGEVPQAWRVPEKIENGAGYRIFHPDYSKVREAEFQVLWGNNLQGGYINAPLAVSSDGKMKPYQISHSSIKVVK